MPLVSVIMPVYNTAEYLDEAVQSILGQTLTDLELIVIDDGAADRTIRSRVSKAVPPVGVV